METRIRALFASLNVHLEAWALEEPVALLDAGEWGLAFEMLCDNLYEAELPLFHGEVAEIERIGKLLRSDRRSWRLIHELEIKDD